MRNRTTDPDLPVFCSVLSSSWLLVQCHIRMSTVKIKSSSLKIQFKTCAKFLEMSLYSFQFLIVMNNFNTFFKKGFKVILMTVICTMCFLITPHGCNRLAWDTFNYITILILLIKHRRQMFLKN